MSPLRPPRYSSVMPKRSLNAAGKARRRCALGGPETTTLPSFFAASTSSSQDFLQSGDCALVSGANRTSISNAIIFFISASWRHLSQPQYFLHAQPNLLLCRHREIPTGGVEVVDGR